MNKNENQKDMDYMDNNDDLKTLGDYDKKLEDMEVQIKELKKIKKRRKKMMELEMEREEILKKMNKSEKSKHK
ncbi:hypothetical protein [Clostridium sp.]|uniref:hypothetical protein n=1 Tax=Clostridium sp. TaxID=1506 RepID=UPI0032169FB4